MSLFITFVANETITVYLIFFQAVRKAVTAGFFANACHLEVSNFFIACNYTSIYHLIFFFEVENIYHLLS